MCWFLHEKSVGNRWFLLVIIGLCVKNVGKRWFME